MNIAATADVARSNDGLSAELPVATQPRAKGPRWQVARGNTARALVYDARTHLRYWADDAEELCEVLNDYEARLAVLGAK